jgi:hypothetical protein
VITLWSYKKVRSPLDDIATHDTMGARRPSRNTCPASYYSVIPHLDTESSSSGDDSSDDDPEVDVERLSPSRPPPLPGPISSSSSKSSRLSRLSAFSRLGVSVMRLPRLAPLSACEGKNGGSEPGVREGRAGEEGDGIESLCDKGPINSVVIVDKMCSVPWGFGRRRRGTRLAPPHSPH